MKNKVVDSGKVRQYVLTGAGLGVYFGWFFRPIRDPHFTTILLLSVLITLVLTCLKWWHGEHSGLLREAVVTFLKYTFFLSILAARHYVFALGGRWAVVSMMVLIGAATGYWMAKKGIKVV